MRLRAPVGTVMIRPGVVLARRKQSLVLFLACAWLLVLPGAGGGASRQATCWGQPPTMVFGSGDDVIIGTTGPDVIIAGGGNDFVVPLTGDDRICAGAGFDLVLFALSPGPVAASLATRASLGEGSDRMAQVEGLVGSEHNDRLIGDTQLNFLVGHSGTDVLEGRGDNDLLAGDVQTYERAGDDRLLGGPGDDTLYGAGGNDTLEGGPGSDQAAFLYAPGRIVADLARGTATGDGVDRLRAIEAVSGWEFADLVVGDSRPNLLSGGPGDDELRGARGDDFLNGAEGRDSLDGGAGRDYCLHGETPRSCEVQGLPNAAPGALRARAAATLAIVRGIAQAAGSNEELGSPTCIAGRATTTQRAGRQLSRRPPPRHTTAIAPPARVRPPGGGGRLLALSLWGITLREPTSQQQESVFWRPTLFRYEPRRRRWAPYRRFARVRGEMLPAGGAVWFGRGGRPFKDVRVRVPRGLYAWAGEVRSEGGGDRVFNWAEPHVNVSGAGGRFQPSCKFSR